MFTNLLPGSCQFYKPGNVFLKDLENISLKCNFEKGASTPISQSLWELWTVTPNFLDGWQLANKNGLVKEKNHLHSHE